MGNQQTKSDFDIQQYSGKWIELARLPNIFQVQCDKSYAIYTLSSDTLMVENQCFDSNDKMIKSIRGVAKPTDESGKLRVTFDGQFENKIIPNYYVLDTDYSTYSIVGTPDRLMAWVLIRSTDIDYESIKKKATLILKNNGYLTSLLKWNNKLFN